MKPSIGVVMATYQPDPRFFRKQIESIRNQTCEDWICVINDDYSDEVHFRQIQETIGSDPRFSITRNLGRLGSYHCFEEALYQVPDSVEFVCLADQDDIWLPDKLERSRRELMKDPGAELVHSDLVIIDDEDRVIEPSTWDFEKRNLAHTDSSQLLLLKNVVTGCTTFFRRSLLDLLLPFPVQGTIPFFHHDLWLALVASAKGRVVSLSEPLIHYRRHGGNVIGPEKHGLGDWTGKVSKNYRRYLTRDWRTGYLRGMRSEWESRRRLSEAFRERIASARAKGAPLAAPTLNAFSALPDFGLSAFGLLSWSVLVGYRAESYGSRVWLGKVQRDWDGTKAAVEKVSRITSGALEFARRKSRIALRRAELITEKRNVGEWLDPRISAPLPVRLGNSSERHYNVLTTTLEPSHIFGGLATALRLGIEIARQGRPVRFIATDLPIPEDRARLRQFLEQSFAGFAEVKDRLQFVDASDRQGAPLTLGREDVFIATAWWTAFQASSLLLEHPFREKKFLYLIQDFEPGFYPWSPDYAAAEHSYRLNYYPIFNTSFLHDYFRERGLWTKGHGWTIQPEIDLGKYFPPSERKMAARDKVRLLVYGRPGVHRNLFTTMIQGMDRWIQKGGLDALMLEIVSAGEPHAAITCANGLEISNVGKIDLPTYPNFLRSFDMGLALMLSPHPSYPPLEMAASGLRTVTNRYANKDLESVSKNFVSCDPHFESIADGLGRAFAGVRDYRSRIEASRLRFVNSFTLEEAVRQLLPVVERKVKRRRGQKDKPAGDEATL